MKIQYLFPIIIASLGLWISCGDTDPVSPVLPPGQPSKPETPDPPVDGKDGFIFSKIFSSEDDEVAIIYDIRQNDVPHIHLQWYDTCRLNKGQYLSFADAGDACVIFRMWGDSISLSPITGHNDHRRFPVPAPIPIIGDIEEKVFFNEDSIFYIKKVLDDGDGKITLKCVLKNQKIEIFPEFSDMKTFDVFNTVTFGDNLRANWGADSAVVSESGFGLEKSPFVVVSEDDNNKSLADDRYSYANVIQSLLNTKIFSGPEYGLKEEKVSYGDLYCHLFFFDNDKEFNSSEMSIGKFFIPLRFHSISSDVCKMFVNPADLLGKKFIDYNGTSTILPKMGAFLADGFEVVSPFIADGIEMRADITEYQTSEYPYFGRHLNFCFVDNYLALKFVQYLIMPLYQDSELFGKLCEQFFSTYRIPEENHDKVMDIIKSIPAYLESSTGLTFGFSYSLIFT